MTDTLKSWNDLECHRIELELNTQLTEQMDSTISPTARPAAQLSYPFNRVISLVDNAMESERDQNCSLQFG